MSEALAKAREVMRQRREAGEVITKKKKHLIRGANGGLVTVTMGRKVAIKAFCSECAGFGEMDVKECPSIYCPLYPFRGVSRVAWGEVEEGGDNEGEE